MGASPGALEVSLRVQNFGVYKFWVQKYYLTLSDSSQL